jgi:hypothetical protein
MFSSFNDMDLLRSMLANFVCGGAGGRAPWWP